ncbi:hypothetical protein OB920_10970 [Halobacteria archaeon HArc-gm2]|nr:hypothetical protein [Halobacteria archaeon HArc-gm2]
MPAASQVDVMRASLSDDVRGAVGAERVAAWFLVLLAAGFAVAIVLQPGLIAASPPDATFSGSYDEATGTLTLQHAGGDAIEDGPTSSLVVVVTDADGESAQNVTWAADGGDAVAAYPVESGDSIAVDDPSVDSDDDGNAFDGDATVGFELDDGDTAAVVWRGRPLGAPGEVTTTLDTVTVSTGS